MWSGLWLYRVALRNPVLVSRGKILKKSFDLSLGNVLAFLISHFNYQVHILVGQNPMEQSLLPLRSFLHSSRLHSRE